MEFLLNIKGQLNNIHLAEAKALWPLFEAVVILRLGVSVSSTSDKNNPSISICSYLYSSCFSFSLFVKT